MSIVGFLLAFAAPSAGIAQNRETTRSFQFREIKLHAALDSLLRWYAIPLIYLDKDIAGKRVNAECSGCGFEDALKKVIEGQSLTWRVIGEQVLLERTRDESATPTATLAGTITDSLTGEWVVGAHVLLQRDEEQGGATIHRWCSANDFGFISLRNIQPGTYSLVVRSIGYREMNERVTVPAGSVEMRDCKLSEQTVMLPEVTVEGRRSALTSSEGISRGVYIRATPSDHNHYLLEGARIYNPNHFGGVLSTFNADAVHDLQILAGGVPPHYGGRIGGILDVTLRSGTLENFSGAAGVGSLGSNLTIEGPLAHQTSFVISGRQGYPEIFLPRRPNRRPPSDLNSSELMAKVSHHLSGNSRLFLSGYFGLDTYESSDAIERLSNHLHWGNATANLRWISVLSPSVFLHASAIYTRYGFDAEQRLAGGGSLELFPSDYRIEDIALRAHAEHFYDEHHIVRGGVELARHNMTGTISEFSTQLSPISMSGFSSWELAVYLQDQWQLLPSVSAELGARATSFIGHQGTFSTVDPRFSLLVSLDDDTRVYSSLTSINQFVHPYRHSGIFLFYPTIFFYPSSENIRPSTSLQVSLGLEKRFQENRYTLAIETYYRITQRVHEFVFDTAQNTRGDLSNVIRHGEGLAYGAECTFSKRVGDLTGSLRYSLSWARNRFAELNGGEPFAPRFDRRHELYGTVSYAISENWTIGTVCLISSGKAPSFAPTSATVVISGDASLVGGERAADFGTDLNGGRIPGFQRIELHVLHRFSFWKLPVQATFRLLNGYGLLDPFVFQLQPSTDNRLRWRASLDAPDLFPLYPVVSLGVRF